MKHLLLAFLVALAAAPASAELRLAPAFTDHAVLQADRPLRVFGTDEPGQRVTVRLAGETAGAEADADGRWLVELPAMAAPGPHRLVAEGSTTVELADVLLGDVWWCGGQSNMEWAARKTDEADELIRAPADDGLRLLRLPRRAADEPAEDIDAAWTHAGEAEAADFSAVALGFGRRLRAETGRPIGLIQCAWGGSSIAAWLPAETLAGLPESVLNRERHDDAVARQEAAIEAWESGGREGKRPVVPAASPQKGLSLLYHGMIHPLGVLSVRGAIWYQGESDSGRPDAYRVLFPRLLETLRGRFGDDRLPLFAVQLPGFRQPTWPAFRAAQRELAEDPALQPTGLAIAIDTGDPDDVHPTRKGPVAERLAVPHSATRTAAAWWRRGPRPRLRLWRRAAASASRSTTPRGCGFELVPASPEEASPFELVLGDGSVLPAEAEVAEPASLVLRPVGNAGGAAPVAVRFGQSPFPSRAIYNAAGLPASPFELPIDR